MSWDLVSLGVTFFLGLAVGVVPWFVWRRDGAAGGEGDAGRVAIRRRMRRVAAVSVGLTLVVDEAGTYAVLRGMLHAGNMASVGYDSVLRELRAEGPSATVVAGSGEPDRLGPPPAGVYTYAASGFYETTAPVFGKERRELPETVPAALRHEPDGWTLTVHFFDRHRTVFRWIAGPGGLLQESDTVTDNVRFGFEVRTTLSCRPTEILRGTMAAGAAWEQDCRAVSKGVVTASQEMGSKTTLVGVEPLVVGGAPVDAWHVRRDTVVSGGQTGTLVRDAWFAVDTGLLLRLDVDSRTSGLADHTEITSLVLTSLVPEV